ncbi:hypothetical protein L9F63_023795, partial [Diploptera punctata]
NLAAKFDETFRSVMKKVINIVNFIRSLRWWCIIGYVNTTKQKCPHPMSSKLIVLVHVCYLLPLSPLYKKHPIWFRQRREWS